MEKLLFLAIFLFITCSAYAGGMTYIWTDENGQTHVSETEPENWAAQEYEDAKESTQADIQMSRERAVREDQLKAAEERKRTLQSQGGRGTDNASGRLPAKRKKG
jgi:hypothetical protein